MIKCSYISLKREYIHTYERPFCLYKCRTYKWVKKFEEVYFQSSSQPDRALPPKDGAGAEAREENVQADRCSREGTWLTDASIVGDAPCMLHEIRLTRSAPQEQLSYNDIVQHAIPFHLTSLTASSLSPPAALIRAI